MLTSCDRQASPGFGGFSFLLEDFKLYLVILIKKIVWGNLKWSRRKMADQNNIEREREGRGTDVALPLLLLGFISS